MPLSSFASLYRYTDVCVVTSPGKILHIWQFSMGFIFFFRFLFLHLCFAVLLKNKEGECPVWSGPAMLKLGLPTFSCFKDSPSLPPPSSPTSWPPPTAPSSRRAAQPQSPSLWCGRCVYLCGEHHGWQPLAIGCHFVLVPLVKSKVFLSSTLPAVFLSSSILFRNFTVRLLDHLGCNRVIKDHRWWSK